jgi:hypothetical protein
MKSRIVLSVLALSCAFCSALGCGSSQLVADDQPEEAVATDAGVASGIGTSPKSLGGGKSPGDPPPPPPGPTDTTGKR